MNKIVVNTKEFTLEQTDVIITDILEKDVVWHIIGKVNCGILNIPDISHMTIYLHENAQLNIDFFLELKDTVNQITIYSAFQSKLNLHYACTFVGNNALDINNHVNANQTETNILVRTVEKEGNLQIKAEGCIYENTISNIYLEDIKALTNHNHSVKIMPNLLVKTNSVIANHNATISNVNEEELFYLESKGLTREKSIELIKSGFLKGILKIEELKMGGEKINE